MRVFGPEKVRSAVTPSLAREQMRLAAVAAWRGALTAPARLSSPLGSRTLRFSTGAVRGDWFGYRSYAAPGARDHDEIVVVCDDETKVVRAIAVSGGFGPLRSGATGAVALDALAPENPRGITLVGAGRQAWHQLWALPDRFREVPIRVRARDERRTEEFAIAASSILDLEVLAAPSVEEAVQGSDVVILATSSSEPVVPNELLRDVRYIATVGPKVLGSAEVAGDLFSKTDCLVTDSTEQLQRYDPAHVVVASGLEESVVHLGALLCHDAAPQGDRIVMMNVGLAGTEAWMLNELWRLEGGG